MITNRLSITDQNELLGVFVENTPLGILIIDNLGKIRITNQLFIDYLNLANDEDDLNNNIITRTTSLPELSSFLKDCIINEIPTIKKEALFINDKYFTISGKRIQGGYIITFEDITKQKEIEANSIQAILESLENERRRIGREIHDGIGPLLSFIKLRINSFNDDLNKTYPSINTEPLDSIGETIDSITIDLRSLSHRLVPRLLDEFGLTSAFENLILRLNETKKVKINFYSNLEKNKRLNKEIELAIFRCGQELINNTVKHAKANNIHVQVILHKKSIVLMVEDDGIGFKKEALRLENYGIGLTNIDTRARLLMGYFNLDSAPQKGTVASLEIPLI
jgi:signal transduction histidine kinase